MSNKPIDVPSEQVMDTVRLEVRPSSWVNDSFGGCPFHFSVSEEVGYFIGQCQVIDMCCMGDE